MASMRSLYSISTFFYCCIPTEYSPTPQWLKLKCAKVSGKVFLLTDNVASTLWKMSTRMYLLLASCDDAHTHSGWAAFQSLPLLLHPLPTLQDCFPSHDCVWGVGSGSVCGCVYLCACIHTCKVFIGQALSSHICRSLILREASPRFHQAAWKSGK